jgi:hypothetical protein
MGDPDVGARSSCIVAVIAKGTQGTAYILPVVGDSAAGSQALVSVPQEIWMRWDARRSTERALPGKLYSVNKVRRYAPRPTPPSLSEVHREHQSGNSRRPLRDKPRHEVESVGRNGLVVDVASDKANALLPGGWLRVWASLDLSSRSLLDHRTRLFRKPGVCDLRFGELRKPRAAVV